jgi:hypothetical protein
VEYIYAQELKKYFSVYGFFYDLRLASGETLPCRSVLEIYSKELPTHQESYRMLFSEKPDALFIMMNPGSSTPARKNSGIPTLDHNDLSRQILNQWLVPAKPDTTQYQVMRVMLFKKWRHVRVINLSDIREPKSSAFVKQVKLINDPIHSIFSPERSSELFQALPLSEKTPIICAWGTNKGLVDLVQLCMDIIPVGRMTGVQASDSFYYHPLPSLVSKQKEWLMKIKECL